MTNMAASTGKGLVEIDAATLRRWLAADMAVLVDVREEWEFADERIPGAINLPLSRFDIRDLPSGDRRRLVLTCAIGRRSAQAADIMLAAGYDRVAHMRGGMVGWDNAGFRIVSGASEMGKAGVVVLPCASA